MRAAELFDRGVALSRSGDVRRAEQVLLQALSTYRTLAPEYAAENGIVRTLWRLSSIRSVCGQPGQAVAYGVDAARRWEALLDGPGARDILTSAERHNISRTRSGQILHERADPCHRTGREAGSRRRPIVVVHRERNTPLTSQTPGNPQLKDREIHHRYLHVIRRPSNRITWFYARTTAPGLSSCAGLRCSDGYSTARVGGPTEVG